MVDLPGLQALSRAHAEYLITRGIEELAAASPANLAFGVALEAYHAELSARVPVELVPLLTGLCRAAAAARLAQANRG